MPELLTPGVIIQEVEFGPQPIEGVSTTTAGFVGETEWGPDAGPPLLVTSFSDFQRKFGSYVSGAALPYSVAGFFDNGGRRAYVARVLAGDATAATVSLNDGYDVALLSGTPAQPTTMNPFTVRVDSVVGLVGGDVVTFINQAGGPVVAATVVPGSINAIAGTVEVTPSASFAVALQPGVHSVRYAASTAASRVDFVALYKGAFGNRLRVRLVPTYGGGSTITAVSGTDISLSSVEGISADSIVELDNATNAKEYLVVASVNVATKTITVTGPSSAAVDDIVRVTTWRLDVFLDSELVETLSGLPSRIASSTALEDAVAQRSEWVRISSTTGLQVGLALDTPSTYAFSLAGAPTYFTPGSGSNGSTPSDSDIIGSDAGSKSGLKAIEAQDGISLIATPGYTSTPIVAELIGQAERTMSRFAIFDSVEGASVTEVLSQRSGHNSRYAAMYYPRIVALDPLTDTEITLPPSGHVAGAFARTDVQRGVFKAPANVVLRSITGFERVVPNGEQDILNPAGVNVLRSFAGLGNVIWGARTISAEGLWRYVPVRRLFIFLEQSIIRGTRYAVFEPNDRALWSRLRDSVTNFLTTQWRAGALFGRTPQEAFFVKVDETTTTEEDRQNGRVNIIVGIAPVRPAEFIVFQIGQAPSSVIIEEQG